MSASRAPRIAVLALILATSTPTSAQPHAPSSTAPSNGPADAAGTPGDASNGLRGRVGSDAGGRLLRSADADDRLRGVERLASTHTPESLALLLRAVEAGVPGNTDAHGQIESVARKDPRALLVAVQGLAAWTEGEPARSALASIVGGPTQSFATRAAGQSADDNAGDVDGAAIILLARQEAAMALAESGIAAALEALIAIARSAGPGQAPALDALAVYPPGPPLLGGVVLTTPPAIALAVAVGDLRSLDAIDSAMGASDPALRAAALAALGIAGDSRVLDGARASLADPDPRVRLAAGDAIVRLGAPDAPTVVETLIADDATALGGLRLAELVQGDGVTKAAAARAAASPRGELRSAAVAALGHQVGRMAVDALSALVADASLAGEAACALARSPNSLAMGAVEAMAKASPRLAGRAYLVRRLVRGERSERLDGLLAGLAASRDGRDRGVGVQALVALGELPLGVALQDADVRVRRAASAASIAVWSENSRAALLAHLVVEPDEPTRQALAVGLVAGDPDGAVSTEELARRAQGSGADAPLAALALSMRVNQKAAAADVDVLLSSHDPLLRAHVARGLGTIAEGDAIGRLVGAYAYESDGRVRRAIVGAIAGCAWARSAPAARAVLELAARLEPDVIARTTAARALSGADLSARPPFAQDVAWLTLAAAEGAALPKDMTGALVSGDGVALPFVFDDDGYAVVLGAGPGGARVRLAPRLPPYEAAVP